MVYQFAPGFSCVIPANIVGERLEQIRQTNSGLLCPRDVVNDARPKNSPLHNAFLWNNRAAAELYREDQARHIIRNIQIIRDNNDNTRPEPIYISVGRPYGKQGYKEISQAFDDDDDCEFILNMARSQLRAWENRYGYLAQYAKDIARVATAIQQLESLVAATGLENTMVTS